MVILTDVLKASSSSNNDKYDVFLSFRGVDTRLSFTSHLHKALEDANLKTFLDDQQIDTGLCLKPELESAIKSSRASIIVLSKNYASSTWCLEELVLILEQHRDFNQIVIPVFYHVEPTDVRKQQGSFGDAMEKHKDMMHEKTNVEEKNRIGDKMEIWKKALTDVSNLKGVDAKDRPETKLIDEIVKDIYHRLHVPLRTTLPLLMGMKYHTNFITSWLKDGSSHTSDILTIYGVGGIGKTSLAKFVYGLHFREFSTSSFIENISTNCGPLNGLLGVQKQLCGDLSRRSLIQVYDGSLYLSSIENSLKNNKVFLVLDDIDSLDQLDVLLGNKGLHPGSKIIITTKDVSLTERCALFKTTLMKPKHKKLLLQGLHETASLKLLCHHAFTLKNPKEGYEEVSIKLAKYCEGHPLALEVLGKTLHNRDVTYWEECIIGLKKEPGSRINNVLKRSFDTLPSENDKELFKHIACFFVGMDKDLAETILNACDINTRTGITHLTERCLLHIGQYNQITMHSLIQDMGRYEVRLESPDKPWKRSRLWCHEEAFKVLKQKKGKGNLLGLILDMRMVEKGKSFEMKTDSLSKMDNLMILHLNYVQIKGSYQNFPEELRWLCMHGFSSKSIPSDLPMEKLVVLDMSYSRIESFGMSYGNPQTLESNQVLTGLSSKNKRLLGSLKILNLSYCYRLRSLGGFCEFPALENLFLTNCTSLIEVCESIEQCGELVLIDFSYCSEFREFLRTIYRLKNIKTLSLNGCNLDKLTFDEDSMKILSTNNIAIISQTTSCAILEAIPRDLKSLTVCLPSSLVCLSLENNNLNVESFPKDFSSLYMLKYLRLGGNPIVSMPICLRSLPRLERLCIRGCKMLMSFEHPPSTLKGWFYYTHKSCPKGCEPLLRKVLFDPEMSPMELFMDFLVMASSSVEFQGIFKFQPMTGVEETVLRSLGWSNLDFLKKRRVGTFHPYQGPVGSQTQMYYEFGIFSTMYGGKVMPHWIRRRRNGPSILFTIPSSPRKIKGLNFCFVLKLHFPFKTFGIPHDQPSFSMPLIEISNKTKNHTWIYNAYTKKVNVGGNCLTFLSHWMFGMNEMEAGNLFKITMKPGLNVKKCGVRVVYEDDGDDKEEDVLEYYKSWNHIIGGDLSAFQTTSGKYILDVEEFTRHTNKIDPSFNAFVVKDEKYKAWSQLEACLNQEVHKVFNGWKGLMIFGAYLSVVDPSPTLTSVTCVLDQCVGLEDISLLIHNDVLGTVLKSFMSECMAPARWPRLKWRWGMWSEETEDSWITDGISNQEPQVI